MIAARPTFRALEKALRITGNGGDEVRNWVIAHSAAGSSGFELVGHEALTEVNVSRAFSKWHAQPLLRAL